MTSPSTTTPPPAEPSVSIALKPIGQIVAALLLAVPCWFAGHLVGYLMAVKAGELPHPMSSVVYVAGEGVMAMIFLGVAMIRIRGPVAARLAIWACAGSVCVAALPLANGMFHTETPHAISLVILFISAALMGLVWLPWWRPRVLCGAADLANSQN